MSAGMATLNDTPKTVPVLEPAFRPASLATRAMKRLARASGKAVPVGIAIEQADGSVFHFHTEILPEGHKDAALKLREIVANYEKERDLILIGAYEEGSDPKVDYAIEKIEEVNTFLKQSVEDKISLEEAVEQLKQIFE